MVTSIDIFKQDEIWPNIIDISQKSLSVWNVENPQSRNHRIRQINDIVVNLMKLEVLDVNVKSILFQIYDGLHIITTGAGSSYSRAWDNRNVRASLRAGPTAPSHTICHR